MKQYAIGERTDKQMNGRKYRAEKELHTYSQLIFDKRAEVIQWGKDSLSNHLCWNNWTSTYKKIDLDTDLIPFTKLNSQWITNLNVKYKTIKHLEDNI